MNKMKLEIMELEAAEEMLSDFWTGYCYGIIIVGGILCAAT